MTITHGQHQTNTTFTKAAGVKGEPCAGGVKQADDNKSWPVLV